MAVDRFAFAAFRSSRLILFSIRVFSLGQVRAADFIAIRCVTRSFRPRCIFFRVLATQVNHSTLMLTMLFNCNSR